MPLWLIFHPTGTFADEASKQALAQDITALYTGFGLPAFYVVVNFIEHAPTSLFIGGRPNTGPRPFVRISVDHIAVKQPDEDAQYHRVATAIDRVLKPHIADRGYDWEFHVDETERRLWRIQGIDPPPFRSDAEKMWAAQNEAVMYESKV